MAAYMRPSFAKLFGIAVIDEAGVAKVCSLGSALNRSCGAGETTMTYIECRGMDYVA